MHLHSRLAATFFHCPHVWGQYFKLMCLPFVEKLNTRVSSFCIIIQTDFQDSYLDAFFFFFLMVCLFLHSTGIGAAINDFLETSSGNWNGDTKVAWIVNSGCLAFYQRDIMLPIHRKMS